MVARNRLGELLLGPRARAVPQDPPWNNLWLQGFPEHSFARGLMVMEKGWVGLILLPDQLIDPLSGGKQGQDIFCPGHL